jgi:hypothetical protein
MGYWRGFVFMPHAEPAKMGSPHRNAQNESETDRFSSDIFRFFFGSRGQAQNLARLHRRFVGEALQAADRMATSEKGRPQSSTARARFPVSARPWVRVRNGKPCGVPFGSTLRVCQKSLPHHHLPAVCDLVSGRGGRLDRCRLMRSNRRLSMSRFSSWSSTNKSRADIQKQT